MCSREKQFSLILEAVWISTFTVKSCGKPFIKQFSPRRVPFKISNAWISEKKLETQRESMPSGIARLETADFLIAQESSRSRMCFGVINRALIGGASEKASKSRWLAITSRWARFSFRDWKITHVTGAKWTCARRLACHCVAFMNEPSNGFRVIENRSAARKLEVEGERTVSRKRWGRRVDRV